MEKLESAEFVCVFVGSNYLYLYVCISQTRPSVRAVGRYMYTAIYGTVENSNQQMFVCETTTTPEFTHTNKLFTFPSAILQGNLLKRRINPH